VRAILRSAANLESQERLACSPRCFVATALATTDRISGNILRHTRFSPGLVECSLPTAKSTRARALFRSAANFLIQATYFVLASTDAFALSDHNFDSRSVSKK
jgi:hypothetical protein